MTMLRTNYFPLTGALFVLAAAAASCGDDTTDGTGTSASSGGSVSATTGGSGGGSSSSGGEGGSGSGSGGAAGGSSSSGSNPQPSLSFFVSSAKSPTGNLGGLAGADQTCQTLAEKVGAGAKTWRAYLSAEKGDNGQPVHARDRIGTGPWYNAKLVMVAANLDELHAAFGDYMIFLDENGEMVPGQWPNSPKPNEHDILTGTTREGMVKVGATCADWTSEDATMFAGVGHSDGLGPMGSSDPMYRPWNAIHDNGGCNDTAPKGGAGRIYCFAAD